MQTTLSKLHALDKWMRKRLTSREDSEHEQALVRLAIGAVIFIYFMSPIPLIWDHSAAHLYIPRLISTSFLLVSLLMFAAILFKPERSLARRLLGMAIDLTTLSIVLALTGKYGTPLFTIYLWVIVGNGFRYGEAYVNISTLMTFIGFSAVLVFSNYWKQHFEIGISLLLLLILLPLYIKVLLRKLYDAIQKANQASEAKSRFLANMSHELRTPLNGVIGMSELLQETRLDVEQRDMVKTVHMSARTLLSLINNILDLSKIEAGKVSIEESDFDLHSLVYSTLRILDIQRQRKGIEISSHIDPKIPFMLQGDPLHLKQVLVNLIGNAIKFTDQGSVTIRVKIAEASNSPPRLRFEVEDTGIGIEAEKIEQIFKDFNQADYSVTRRYGGTGLGTTIAKQLVELMNGTIGVESTPGKGSTFWFEVPLKTIKPEAGDDIMTSLDTMRVLMLASEKQAATIRSCLRDWGVDFDWATTPARTLSLMYEASEKNTPYGVALIEQSMLGMNPEQFSALVRNDESLAAIPLVLLTASAAGYDETRTLETQYTSVLSQPFDKTLLFNALHAAQCEHEVDDNVVTLSEYYGRTNSPKELNILVAEDNETNQKVIRGIIERAGHYAHLVDDGEQALEELTANMHRYDLVILDMNMPQRSGIDVLKAFRFFDTSASLPVLMVTADATTETMQACKTAGADAYITKPIDAHILLEKIAHFSRKRSTAVLRPQQNPAASNTIGYQRDNTLDRQILDNLANLGSGIEFVADLIEGFRIDSMAILIQAEQARTEGDYLGFREALHALKGSASELGSIEFVQQCSAAEKLKAYEMSGPAPGRHISRLQQAHARLIDALQNYISQARNIN